MIALSSKLFLMFWLWAGDFKDFKDFVLNEAIETKSFWSTLWTFRIKI